MLICLKKIMYLCPSVNHKYGYRLIDVNITDIYTLQLLFRLMPADIF